MIPNSDNLWQQNYMMKFLLLLTFLSAWAAFRNLFIKTYAVGTDMLNCNVLTINFSCIVYNEQTQLVQLHNSIKQFICNVSMRQKNLPYPEPPFLCMLCLIWELDPPPQELKLLHTCMPEALQLVQPTEVSFLPLSALPEICL